jgi:hypothetical protein
MACFSRGFLKPCLAHYELPSGWAEYMKIEVVCQEKSNNPMEWGALFKNIKNILIGFTDCGKEGSCHGKPD